MPGGSSVMRYWPVLSVTAVRVFSISVGLEASTVTPGRTAPDASLTTPASVACAYPDEGRTTNQATTNRIRLKALILSLLCRCERPLVCRPGGKSSCGELAGSSCRASLFEMSHIRWILGAHQRKSMALLAARQDGGDRLGWRGGRGGGGGR